MSYDSTLLHFWPRFSDLFWIPPPLPQIISCCCFQVRISWLLFPIRTLPVSSLCCAISLLFPGFHRKEALLWTFPVTLRDQPWRPNLWNLMPPSCLPPPPHLACFIIVLNMARLKQIIEAAFQNKLPLNKM